MNLNTVTEVKRPASTEEIPEWREGYAWLAGGTWLFSTPQIAHEVHLWAPGLDVIGMGFAGVPGVLIGHNRRLAWTTTTGDADEED